MGARGLAIRDDLEAAALRQFAQTEPDRRAALRALAIAQALDGTSRAEAARVVGRERQSLRDAVTRYNAEGLAGLSDRAQPGPKPRLVPDQEAEVARWVEAGPDPAKHGVVRWRRMDLQALIAERFGVELHERSVGKLLARLRFRRLSPRPRHPGHDAQAQASFGATSLPS